MDQYTQLNEIASKMRKQNQLLCCKLDQVIEASGGSPTLYNTANITQVNPGDGYSLPEGIHSFSFVVTGGSTDTADVTIGAGNASVPIGYSDNFEASTVFAEGHFVVSSGSTATVYVTTISA